MLPTHHRTKFSESITSAVCMALVGGYLDMYTYLNRGKVFANTQTGNLVLLGHNLATCNWKKVIYYVFPIVFFMLGVALTEWLEHRFRETKRFSWRQVSLGVEILFLCIVMMLPKGNYDVLSNIIVSFVCGLQVHTFRKVNGISYSTTMFTGNVKNAAANLTHHLITKEEVAKKNGLIYLTIILMFILGAVVETIITAFFYEKSVGFVNVILLFVIYMLYLEKKHGL